MISVNTSGAQGFCNDTKKPLGASIYFERAGTPYTSTPTISFSGGGGSGAAATANLAFGGVSSVDVTNHGSLYTSAPTVAFSGGGSAAGTAVLSDTAVIKSLTRDAGGTGYTNGTHNLVFTGGGGAGATGTATISGGVVTAITLGSGGSGYTSAPGISLASSAGSGDGGFSAHATLGYTVDSITLTNSGGYGVTITDKSTYAAGDGINVINLSFWDKHGNKVEKQITSSPSTVDLIGLDTFDEIKSIVTVVSDLGAVKDGSVHGMLVPKQVGYYDIEK